MLMDSFDYIRKIHLRIKFRYVWRIPEMHVSVIKTCTHMCKPKDIFYMLCIWHTQGICIISMFVILEGIWKIPFIHVCISYHCTHMCSWRVEMFDTTNRYIEPIESYIVLLLRILLLPSTILLCSLEYFYIIGCKDTVVIYHLSSILYKVERNW